MNGDIEPIIYPEPNYTDGFLSKNSASNHGFHLYKNPCKPGLWYRLQYHPKPLTLLASWVHTLTSRTPGAAPSAALPDDHLQEADHSVGSFARGWFLLMIICKRPAPPDDHLQEAGLTE